MQTYLQVRKEGLIELCKTVPEVYVGTTTQVMKLCHILL